VSICSDQAPSSSTTTCFRGREGDRDERDLDESNGVLRRALDDGIQPLVAASQAMDCATTQPMPARMNRLRRPRAMASTAMPRPDRPPPACAGNQDPVTSFGFFTDGQLSVRRPGPTASARGRPDPGVLERPSYLRFSPATNGCSRSILASAVRPDTVGAVKQPVIRRPLCQRDLDQMEEGTT
jgi:hypothetical protein